VACEQPGICFSGVTMKERAAAVSTSKWSAKGSFDDMAEEAGLESELWLRLN
jgi:hypothetical protein